MLRICFIGGYAVLLIIVITLMAIKVISVLGPGGLGDWAKSIADVIFQPQTLITTAVAVGAGFFAWVIALLKIAKRSDDWEKNWVKSLIIGCIFMSGFFVVLAIVGASVFLLDGFAGEVAARIAGFMSSPVLMETSFFLIGVFLLISFNIVRRNVEGAEFVEVEIPDHVLADLNKEKSEPK